MLPRSPRKAAGVTPVPAIRHPARTELVTERVRLDTDDDVALHARTFRDTARAATEPLGFVVGHGFTHHLRHPAVVRVLARLARHGTVLGIDFRGHGSSDGACTLGVDEVRDLDAAVRHLRQWCSHVVTLGFSMGGMVALRHAALAADGVPAAGDRPKQGPDAVLAVSSPARWWVRETAAMRRVHWLVEQPHGRWGARLLGVRLAGPWMNVPASPIELVGDITCPLLLVHGEQDHYFPIDEARALSTAAGAPLWAEPGMRHAESATTSGLVDRIARWAIARVGDPNVPTSNTELPVDDTFDPA